MTAREKEVNGLEHWCKQNNLLFVTLYDNDIRQWITGIQRNGCWCGGRDSSRGEEATYARLRTGLGFEAPRVDPNNIPPQCKTYFLAFVQKEKIDRLTLTEGGEMPVDFTNMDSHCPRATVRDMEF